MVMLIYFKVLANRPISRAPDAHPVEFSSFQNSALSLAVGVRGVSIAVPKGGHLVNPLNKASLSAGLLLCTCISSP